MEVRPGCSEELPAVMTVFDSGGLEVQVNRVERALDGDHLLVAVQDGRVLGALLFDSELADGTTEIEAIAVRPGRRGQGIGRALVRSAAERSGSLVATFDPPARPFWASLGFEITPTVGQARYLARADGVPCRD